MSRRTIAILFIAVTLLVVAGLTLTARRFVREVREGIFEPREKTVDLTAIVTRVRELHRLETAAMRVIHVSTTTQTYQYVPNSLGGDELTFLATGDVISGFDLAQLKQNDVWREPDGTIVLRLPPPQILVSRLDNRESRVLHRKTGMLRRTDINLESRARQNAEMAIRNEAVKKGVLTLAQQNGEKKLAELLHTFGFQKVRIVRQGPSSAERQ